MPTNRTKENDIVIPAASTPTRRKSSAVPRAKHSVKRSIVEPESEAIEMVAVESVYEPSEGEIAALAYTYWAGRGCQGGSAEEDWLRAEQELRSKAGV